MWYSLFFPGYKPVQHVTVLNTVGNCNTVVSIIMLYYNLMAPPSYMQFVIARNVFMRHVTVSLLAATNFLHLTKILHNSHCTHRKELHLILRLHPSRHYFI